MSEKERREEMLLRLMRLQVESLQLALDLQTERRGPTPAKSASGRARPVLVERKAS